MGPSPLEDVAMTAHFDISELATAVEQLEAHPGVKKLAVVVPIAEGHDDLVRAYLSEGPPFDLASAGIDSHEVFLTPNEVIFVFGAADGLAKLDRILAETEFWETVSSWERVIAARPRAAQIVYDWHA